MRVSVQSPEGIETELTERSKMHYLDHFWAVLSDAWKQHTPTSGMTPVKLKESLLAQEASCDVNAVWVSRPASIRFLDTKTLQTRLHEEDRGGSAANPGNGAI